MITKFFQYYLWNSTLAPPFRVHHQLDYLLTWIITILTTIVHTHMYTSRFSIYTFTEIEWNGFNIANNSAVFQFYLLLKYLQCSPHAQRGVTMIASMTQSMHLDTLGLWVRQFTDCTSLFLSNIVLVPTRSFRQMWGQMCQLFIWKAALLSTRQF